MGRKLLLPAWIAALGLAACGGDDETEKKGGNDQATAAQTQTVTSSTTTTITGIQSATVSGDGQTASSTVLSAALSNQSLAASSGGQPLTVQALIAGAAQNTGAQTSACDCDETAKSCTFDGCGVSSGAGSFSVSGTMSWSETTFVANVTYTGSQQGVTYTIDLDANLTLTATELDGTMNVDGEYDISSGSGAQIPGGSLKVEFTNDSTYSNVTYNSSGCPTGGSVAIDASYTASGQSSSFDGTIEFDGSNC